MFNKYKDLESRVRYLEHELRRQEDKYRELSNKLYVLINHFGLELEVVPTSTRLVQKKHTP